MSDTVKHSENQGVEGNTKTSTLRARGWCFTLSNYSDEEYETLKSYGHTNTVKYVIGKEVAPTTGTKHLQGYYYHKNPTTFTRMKSINDRAHWEKAKGSPEENLTYCTKEGESIQEGFTAKKALQEIIKEELLQDYDGVVWKPWQQTVIANVEKKPDSRTINWIYDRVGNQGKSYLTKYLALTRDVIIADGKKDNIFNQVNRMLNVDERRFELVMLDIPRSAEGYINYGVLEQLKNGLLYSGKYEGGLCLFGNVHVIVFANFLPDLSQFSEDRWNIIDITN